MRHALKILRMAAAVLVAVAAVSCAKSPGSRIPAMPVYVSFSTAGDWHLYGVLAPMETRVFNIGAHLPSGFTYTGQSATGYGGLLLVGTYAYSGNLQVTLPAVYDRSCPIEALPDVTVEVARGATVAKCPKCGSTYDIFGGLGLPKSGPAAEQGYMLRSYRITTGTWPYVLITR